MYNVYYIAVYARPALAPNIPNILCSVLGVPTTSEISQIFTGHMPQEISRALVECLLAFLLYPEPEQVRRIHCYVV